MQLSYIMALPFRYRAFSWEKKHSAKLYTYFFKKQKQPITELEKLSILTEEKAYDG